MIMKTSLPLLILALSVVYLASAQPIPAQIEAFTTTVRFCRKRKSMRFDPKTRSVVPTNSTRRNNTAFVHWGCVGPQQLTATGVYVFTDLRQFDYYFGPLVPPPTPTPNAPTRPPLPRGNQEIVFRQAPSITFAPRTQPHRVLKIVPTASNVLSCVAGSARLSSPKLTNTSMRKGSFNRALLPRSWVRNNITNFLRVSVNFTCTVDFSNAAPGYYQYDLSISTRGTAFTFTRNHPLLVNVPQPYIAHVRGCGKDSMFSTSGCIGRGSMPIRIFGWGFSQNILFNTISFISIDFSSASVPWCGIAEVRDARINERNLTVWGSGRIKIRPTDPNIDQVPQVITCNFWMYGRPGAEITGDARPRGRFLPRVVVENRRATLTGERFAFDQDYRPFIELQPVTDAPFDSTLRAVPVTPIKSAACEVLQFPTPSPPSPLTPIQLLPRCQTGRILSYQFSFRPQGFLRYAFLQSELNKLNFTITSRVPVRSGSILPTCLPGTYNYRLVHNITRICNTVPFRIVNRPNYACVVNATVRCALNLTGVPPGFGRFRVNLGGTPVYSDPTGSNFDIFAESPVIYRAHSSCDTCRTNPYNKTMIITGLGFSNILSLNRVVFTPRAGASIATPECRIYKVKIHPNKIPYIDEFLRVVPQEIHCYLSDFPTPNVNVFGDFALTVVSDGRTSNSTTYSVAPLTLTSLRGCNSPSASVTSLSCTNPEVIELTGTGFRQTEVRVEVLPLRAGALCLPLNPRGFASNTSRTPWGSFNPSPFPTSTKLSCMLLIKSAGTYQIRVTQRGHFSNTRTISVYTPRILEIRGCKNAINSTSVQRPRGLLNPVCTGPRNIINVLVEYPSAIAPFNRLSFGPAANGVVPTCEYNSTILNRPEYGNSVDLRKILSPDAATNAAILRFFGEWPHFTSNLYSQRRLRRQSIGIEEDVRGPYWFTCAMRSYSSDCPGTRAAVGVSSVRFRTLYHDDVAFSQASIIFPGPIINSVDASSFCEQIGPDQRNLLHPLRIVKKRVGQYVGCKRSVRTPVITIFGSRLDECEKHLFPPRQMDRCRNDVTEAFRCRILLTPNDAVARASAVSPICEIQSFRFDTKLNQIIVCRIISVNPGLSIGISGTWRIGITVDGRQNDINQEEFTFQYAAPSRVSILPLDKTCNRRSIFELECFGRRNVIAATLIGEGVRPSIRFVPIGASPPHAEYPFCSPQHSFNRTRFSGFNKSRRLSNSTYGCTVDFRANVTIGGRWEAIVSGFATGMYITWVSPQITALGDGGACRNGCPYRFVDVVLSGTALPFAQISLHSINAYPAGFVPTCTPTHATWNSVRCRIYFETLGKPAFGSFFFQTSQIVKWPGTRVNRRALTFTSALPEVMGVLSKNCRTGPSLMECDVGTAVELTIAGRHFPPDAREIKVSLRSPSETYTCAVFNVTHCVPWLHGPALCASIRDWKNVTGAPIRDIDNAPLTRYGKNMGEIIRCIVTVSAADTSIGTYSISLSSVGLVSRQRPQIQFKAPIVATPVLATRIREDCFATANPIRCCTQFVETLAVSAGLPASSGVLQGCSRGSTAIRMQFTAAIASPQALVAQIANALTNPSSPVNRAYSVMSSLSAVTTGPVDRANGKRAYYACNTKDPKFAKSVQAFLATCKTEKAEGATTEVVCSGSIENSGCYANPTGVDTYFRSPSPQVTMCQRLTTRSECNNQRYNGILTCRWLPFSWQCVAREEDAYQAFKI